MMSAKSYKGSKATKYGIGQKKPLTQTARNGGFRDSVFQNKDDPNYRPNYGSTYTTRQQNILDGLIDLKYIRPNELSIIYRKAEQMEDTESYEIALELYNRKMNPEGYFPKYSKDEARAILERLTPWPIDWGDPDD